MLSTITILPIAISSMCWSNFYSCFAVRSRANAFCHSRLQTRIPGESDQIDQRSRSADIGDSTTQTPAPLRSLHFFLRFVCPREKKKFFAPDSVFTQIHALPNCYSSLYCSHTRTVFAHFVVDMTMLTWEWHDDKTAPRHSSVTRKFSN